MLGRAARDYQPTASSRNDLAKQLFPSSSPAQDGNIGDHLKKARPLQTGLAKSNALPLSDRSPNSSLETSRRSYPTVSASAGLGALLARDHSFRESVDPLVQARPSPFVHSRPSPSIRPNTVSSGTRTYDPVEFDENDFDDDADLDLDFEIPARETMAAPPRPRQEIEIHSPTPLPPLERSTVMPGPSSSAIAWSSSPPANKLAPLRRQAPAVEVDAENQNPRPPKRRTLPWAQQTLEEDGLVMVEADAAGDDAIGRATNTAQTAMCFKCKKKGHYVKDCPSQGNSAWSRTPTAKEKIMPWNTTASALKEQKTKKRTLAKSEEAHGTAAFEASKRKTIDTALVSLSSEQITVRKLVVNESKSVFFTGSAGTGKSVLMRAIIRELRKKYSKEPDRVAITASTGLAACNIGGVTLHSFAGIGLGKEDVPSLVKKIKRNPKAKQRWLRTKILIIDEVSMVDGDLFDKLEAIARSLRNNGRPFGGIQLVVTGDFFQLPPVPDYDAKARGVKFAFDAATWATAIHHTIGLTEVFRQKDPGKILET